MGSSREWGASRLGDPHADWNRDASTHRMTGAQFRSFQETRPDYERWEPVCRPQDGLNASETIIAAPRRSVSLALNPSCAVLPVLLLVVRLRRFRPHLRGRQALKTFE